MTWTRFAPYSSSAFYIIRIKLKNIVKNAPCEFYEQFSCPKRMLLIQSLWVECKVCLSHAGNLKWQKLFLVIVQSAILVQNSMVWPFKWKPCGSTCCHRLDFCPLASPVFDLPWRSLTGDKVLAHFPNQGLVIERIKSFNLHWKSTFSWYCTLSLKKIQWPVCLDTWHSQACTYTIHVFSLSTVDSFLFISVRWVHNWYIYYMNHFWCSSFTFNFTVR